MGEVHRVIKTQDGKYDVLLFLTIDSKRAYVVVSGLARAPGAVRVSEIGGGVIKLELFDQFEQGFLTCLLNRKQLEEDFASIKCCPGNVWVISEETLLRHRKCEGSGSEGSSR